MNDFACLFGVIIQYFWNIINVYFSLLWIPLIKFIVGSINHVKGERECIYCIPRVLINFSSYWAKKSYRLFSHATSPL